MLRLRRELLATRLEKTSKEVNLLIEDIKKHPNSLTGHYLSGKKEIPVPRERRSQLFCVGDLAALEVEIVEDQCRDAVPV